MKKYKYKGKPKSKLELLIEKDDAYKNRYADIRAQPIPKATPRAPHLVAENKRRLWAAMQTQPAVAELAKTDFVFRRLLQETIEHFEVAEVTVTNA